MDLNAEDSIVHAAKLRGYYLLAELAHLLNCSEAFVCDRYEPDADGHIAFAKVTFGIARVGAPINGGA